MNYSLRKAMAERRRGGFAFRLGRIVRMAPEPTESSVDILYEATKVPGFRKKCLEHQRDCMFGGGKDAAGQ